MTEHRTGTREEWRRARVELLELEKDRTRRADELARMRRELRQVRIDKPYEFETDEGTKTLAELFAGRSQLLVYHFMFGPDWDAGCFEGPDGPASLLDLFEGRRQLIVVRAFYAPDVTTTAEGTSYPERACVGSPSAPTTSPTLRT